jgi:hypothetical protein
VDSFEQLMDVFYLPAEYPGQQRFLCMLNDGTHAERLVAALASGLAARVPSAQMGVHRLGGLDWSSRESVVASLTQALEGAAPHLTARLPQRQGNGPRRADQHLRALMDPPDDVPERVLSFVMAVPPAALREDMLGCFQQLEALMAGSDHNWIVVAPADIAHYGQGLEYATAFVALFEAYEVRFAVADLPLH